MDAVEGVIRQTVNWNASALSGQRQRDRSARPVQSRSDGINPGRPASPPRRSQTHSASPALHKPAAGQCPVRGSVHLPPAAQADPLQLFTFHRHRAEGNVADHGLHHPSPLPQRDQSIFTQIVHQLRFGIAAEGTTQQRVDSRASIPISTRISMPHLPMSVQVSAGSSVQLRQNPPVAATSRAALWHLLELNGVHQILHTAPAPYRLQ